jgi:acyl carrier protein
MSDRSKYQEPVRVALHKLGLLSPAGTLLRVDSMTLMDLLVELEDASGLRIDVAELTEDVFESVESLAGMLERIAEKSA